MLCPECRALIDDDAEKCPYCGYWVLNEDQDRVPASFTFASVLLGVVSIAVWGAVLAQKAHGFIPLTLIAPLIGYWLGEKGARSSFPKTARLGKILSLLAIIIALVYVVFRAGNEESIFWLEA